MSNTLGTWHILGVGAIGSLWACSLASAGYDVRLLLSPSRKTANTTQTLSLEQDGKIQHFSVAVAKADERIDKLLVCTKAGDVITAITALKTTINPQAQVVLLCNGMGFHRDVAKLLPQTKLFAASTTDGAWLRDAFHCVHAGKGNTRIAAFSNNADTATLLANLANNTLSLAPHNDADTMLLEKLAINAVINGLTAIYQCRNGELLSKVDACNDLKALSEECSQILKAAGHKNIAEALWSNVHKVVMLTAKNYSSTYADIQQGRNSELAYFNGYLCTIAKQLNIKAPLNQSVIARTKALEQAKVQR